MNTTGHVRIEMTGHGRGRVLIDGVVVPRVKSVSCQFLAHGVNVVTLELNPSSVIVEGPACIETTTGADLDALCGLTSRPAGMTDAEVRAEFVKAGLLPRDPDDAIAQSDPEKVASVAIQRIYPCHYVVDNPPAAEHDPETLAAVEATRAKLKQLGD